MLLLLTPAKVGQALPVIEEHSQDTAQHTEKEQAQEGKKEEEKEEGWGGKERRGGKR